MSHEPYFIAGRYNKYNRNLSQTPWVDKNDQRIKNSVQELIEEGIRKYLKFDRCIFSSSGREDVDVRMLGRGRPFVFRLVEVNMSTITDENVLLVENYVNEKFGDKIAVRDLQIVSKSEVAHHIKDGEESKKKEYRALCCCSRKLTPRDLEVFKNILDLVIHQKTPIRVLHRRSAITRNRTIYNVTFERLDMNKFTTSIGLNQKEQLFSIKLLTEAGTYIKEFVHGDFGRTEPNLATLLGDCQTDLIELDVMEIYLDWPPKKERYHNKDMTSTVASNFIEDNENCDIEKLYQDSITTFKKAETTPFAKRHDILLSAQKQFEKLSFLVKKLDIFSKNETIEDVSTGYLKYLLIPSYLAKIALLSDCRKDRVTNFERAEEYIKEFISEMMGLNLLSKEQEKKFHSDPKNSQLTTSLQEAMDQRTEKIENYKKFKLLEDRIEFLENKLKIKEQLDESDVREYYMKLITKHINDSLENLTSEIRPALLFEKNSPVKQPDVIVSKLQEPITIVKNQLQKQVFGLGYPSHPTVTVDEFITKKIADGDLVFDKHKQIYGNSLQKYAENPTLYQDQEEEENETREKLEDKDDPIELARKRNWDEFKDDNPEGSGNRLNRG